MISKKWKVRSRESQDSFTLHTLYFLLWLLPTLLAILIYAPTISHPLMYDTLLHTQLADGQSLLSVFLPDERFGFYRPLVFLPIVFFQNLLGRYPAWLFHWINIVTHALNALLLTKLVWRMTNHRWQSLAAGLLLASFPFAYQALAIYGNNPYLTVTFFLLVGMNLVASDQWSVTSSDRQSATGHWLLVPIFVLGVLVHETMVLLIPLFFSLSWLRYYQTAETLSSQSSFSIKNLRGLSASAVIFLLDELRQNWLLYTVCAIYLIIYLFLPRGGSPQLDFGGNGLLPKLLLFLQTAAWPFVLGLYQLLEGRPAILIGFALFVGSTGYLLWAKRGTSQAKALWLGLLWFLLASLLIGVTLPTYYIEDGARLLYPSAAGVAIVWGTLLSPKDLSGFKNLKGLMSSVVLIGLIIAGSWFNWRMINLYEMGSRPIAAIGEALAEDRADDDLILVNLPQWTAWPEQVFPAGTEFAPVMGSHLFATELVRANFGLTPEITILDAPELLAETPYTYGVYRVGALGSYKPIFKTDGTLDPTIQVVAIEYQPGSPNGFWRGSLVFITRSMLIVQDWSTASFGFGIQSACLTSDGSILYTSEIWPQSDINESASLFVQALTSDNRLIAQNDGPPLKISPQRLMVDPEIKIIDRRILIPSDILDKPAGSVVLSGVYNFMTGERETATDLSGASLPDNGQRILIEPTCQ